MRQILLRVLILTVLCWCFQLQAQTRYDIEIVGKPHFSSLSGTTLGDTIIVEFNLYENRGTQQEKRQMFIRDTDQAEISISERIGRNYLRPPLYIPGSLEQLSKVAGSGNIPESITVSILVDRSGSITAADMAKIKEAVRSFVFQLPEGSVFYSWFHNDVSSTSPIGRSNFESANFDTSPYDTDLYNAIHMKLLEFDSLAVMPNALLEPGYVRNNELARRNTDYNYLVILTDGEDDIRRIGKYNNPAYQRIISPVVRRALEDYADRVRVFVLGFGETTQYFNEEELIGFTMANKNYNGYFLAEPDSVIVRFQTILEQMSADYRALFTSPPDRTYRGDEIVFEMEIVRPLAAFGEASYAVGSPTRPYKTEKRDMGRVLVFGILGGLVFFIILLIIIQLVWPLIKNQIFKSRFVARFHASSIELKKTCPYCYDEFHDGDKIVVRCEHFVHLECWNENGHMCPEYGQNCTNGKQEYFDISDPFSRKNKLFYLNWVLYGLLGGFISWIVYMLMFDIRMFDGISAMLVNMFPSESRLSNLNQLVDKMSPLFLIGVLMGFMLSLLFANVEEYRKRSADVVGRILLRGLIGGLVGFVSFFIGNIFIALINKPFTSIWTDWIPWLFFGGMVGYSLTVKTTMVWKHGLFGGLISIFFSFIVISASLVGAGSQFVVLLIAFMLYGAGLGASIATVRSSAEHYFIKILNGPKQGGMIAVHKWMNVQGGMNEVYIGRSIACEVQINWEKRLDVAEKHAKMYINKPRKIPVLVSLQKDKTTLYDERVEMMVGKEYDLVNGSTFKIGETIFQYVEKD